MNAFQITQPQWEILMILQSGRQPKPWRFRRKSARELKAMGLITSSSGFIGEAMLTPLGQRVFSVVEEVMVNRPPRRDDVDESDVGG